MSEAFSSIRATSSVTRLLHIDFGPFASWFFFSSKFQVVFLDFRLCSDNTCRRCFYPLLPDSCPSNDISQYLAHLGTGGGGQTRPLPDPKGTRLVLALRGPAPAAVGQRGVRNAEPDRAGIPVKCVGVCSTKGPRGTGGGREQQGPGSPPAAIALSSGSTGAPSDQAGG